MTPTISYLLSLLAGYLLGSISASIVLSRAAFHQDVRTAGSGNAGATNAARVFGMGAGIITFFGDFLKTLIAMFIGHRDVHRGCSGADWPLLPAVLWLPRR